VGEGGMGAVWLATEVQLGRKVALELTGRAPFRDIEQHGVACRDTRSRADPDGLFQQLRGAPGVGDRPAREKVAGPPGAAALTSPDRLAKMEVMAETVVNIHAAKTQLSRLVARAERGERITIARDGKPVAELGPARRRRGTSLPADDPLLNLGEFAVEGAGGALANDDIDRVLYGRP
jgi:prevent-host-death family protein